MLRFLKLLNEISSMSDLLAYGHKAVFFM